MFEINVYINTPTIGIDDAKLIVKINNILKISYSIGSV